VREEVCAFVGFELWQGVGGGSFECLEGASGGLPDRHYVTEQREYALTNQGLWVRVISRASEYFGDEGGSTGGPQKVRIIEGVLKRAE